MRGDAQLAQLHDQDAAVVALFGTQGLGAGWQRLGQVQGCSGLGGAGGPGQYAADRKAIAAFHLHVADEAEPAGLAVALAEQPGVRVGGRGMGLGRALLALEVALAVEARRRRLPGAILRPEALHRRPSLDQGAVDREVLVGEQRRKFGSGQHGGEELGGDLTVEQPVAVLGEHGHVPDRVVDPEPNEPAEQQVVVQLLHQLPLGADRVERLQQERPQQLLRRDRGPPVQRVEPLKLRRQTGQHAVDQRQDRPQRMSGRHLSLAAHIAEQTFRPSIPPAYQQPRPNLPHAIESRPDGPGHTFFGSVSV